MLPKFYVGVIFQEIPSDSFYIGGEPAGTFIRVSIEHIARTLSDDQKAWWLELTNEVIAPFVKGSRLQLGVPHRRNSLRSLVSSRLSTATCGLRGRKEVGQGK